MKTRTTSEAAPQADADPTGPGAHDDAARTTSASRTNKLMAISFQTLIEWTRT